MNTDVIEINVKLYNFKSMFFYVNIYKHMEVKERNKKQIKWLMMLETRIDAGKKLYM